MLRNEIAEIMKQQYYYHSDETKIDNINKILALPVGGEVKEDCEIYKTATDIYKDCSHCENLKEDQNEWYCGTEGKITRAKTIADCEGE